MPCLYMQFLLVYISFHGSFVLATVLIITHLFDHMIVDAKTNERSAQISFLQKFSVYRKHLM